MMPLITLTTDLGEQDYYAGALKGLLLRHCPEARLIDISHAIPSHDIVRGAFILKNAFAHFPEGTIHLVCVHHFYESGTRLLALRFRGHYFLGPDNGLFSLLFEAQPEAAIALENPGEGLLAGQETLARAIASLAAGEPFDSLGPPAGEIAERILLRPVVSAAQIRGTVIHIDKFENVVVNIDRELFDRVRQGRDFALFFKRHEPITRLSAHYGEAPMGEPLCLFNPAGYLEISIRLGKAASLLGLGLDDAVRIDFA
jgi:S-adenosyl-L-methionine hydrolase (adenosine-forming)